MWNIDNYAVDWNVLKWQSAFQNTFVIPQERAGDGEAKAETTDKQNKLEFSPVAGINTDESGNTTFLMFMLTFILFSHHSLTELMYLIVFPQYWQ